MPLNFDTSKLSQAAGRKATPHDNCTVLDLGSGSFPRDIEVRLPGDDGARQTAVWDGGLDLAINNKVLCHEYSGQSAWRVVSMGGNESGVGKVKVSEIWDNVFSSVALQADATGNVGIGTAGPDAQLDVLDTAGPQLRLTFEDGVKFADFTVDTNHDLTIAPSSTGIVKADSYLSVNIGTQEYQLRGRAGSTALQFEAQNPGDNSIFEMFTKDGDGTDVVGIRLHAVGTTGSIANRERLEIRSQGVAGDPFLIFTEAQGTGTLPDLIIYTEGNTDQMRLDTGGNVGFSVAAPQARIHSYGAIAGFLPCWEYDGLDATVRTVIPNGAGDVLYRLRATYVMRDSAGAVAGATANVNNGASTNLTVGTNTVRLRVNADGSVDVARTAGADTIKITLMLNWL